MNTYENIALRIIKEQELLIGPVAWYEAGKVKGLKISDEKIGIISIEKNVDASFVINDLIDRFGSLFGRAGREVCKEAVTVLIADLELSQVPSNLR